MKKIISLVTFLFCLSLTSNAQATLDSVKIVKYPFFLSNCGDSVCEDGLVDIYVSNATTPYRIDIFYLNGITNLLYSNYWFSSGTFRRPICRDSLLFVITDTSFNTSDSILIPIEDLYCPMDTIAWVHPVVPIDSVQILAVDTIFSIPDTIPTGVVRIYPQGGHQPGYLYKLDTVLNGSFPQPPTSSNPGFNLYRNWQSSPIFDSLFSRWYGVTCIDTSTLVPVLSPKPGVQCVFCGGPPDTIEPFWFYVPSLSAGSGGAPVECTPQLITDCNPNTGSTMSLRIVGGMPPYTVSITGQPNTKVYNYSGNYTAYAYPNNCGAATITITDSFNLVSCTYTDNDVKESMLQSITTVPSYLHLCCNGYVTFSLYTTPGCGGMNGYTIRNSSNVIISSGTANNGQIVTVNNLCPGNYFLYDSTFCVNWPFTIGMVDRPCDSSISIQEQIELQNFTLFPNPTSDDVTIAFDNTINLEGNLVIEIYNLYGEKMDTHIDYNSGAPKYSKKISLKELSIGSYILTVKHGERSSRRIIIKK